MKDSKSTIIPVEPDTQVELDKLLKEVIDWDTKAIATGRIVHVGESLSQARVLKYSDKSLIQIEDWVIIQKNTKSTEKNELKYKPKI